MTPDGQSHGSVPRSSPRVVVVTTSYPRWPGDHAGEFVRGSVRALEAAGAVVSVIAPPAEDAIHDAQVTRVRLPRAIPGARLAYSGGIPDQLERDPRAWLGAPGLSAALIAATTRRAWGADRVVGHWLAPGALAAVIAGATARIPATAVLHSGGVSMAERLPLGAQAARLVARRARRLIFTNERLRGRFLALLRPALREATIAKSTVLAMGIDPAALGPAVSRRSARRRLDVAGRFVVGFLGRCVPVKGLRLLVQAASRVPDAVVAVAGAGPELEAARRAAAKAGVDLRALGPVEGPARTGFFAACDVLALPSVVLPSGRTEGTPVVLLEALSQGLPVVASDVGGVPDVLSHGETGYVVPAGDVASLANHLRQLGDRPTLRRRMARAAADAGRRHHWDHVGPELAAALLTP